jgi:transcriptional repressor NrdR
VEDALRGSGQAEFAAHEVGMAILAPLRELDDVAFLRFASVYKQFESADDFEIEIASLRQHRAEQLASLLDDTALDSDAQDHLTSAPSG